MCIFEGTLRVYKLDLPLILRQQMALAQTWMIEGALISDLDRPKLLQNNHNHIIYKSRPHVTHIRIISKVFFLPS